MDRNSLWFKVLSASYGVEGGRVSNGGREVSAWWRDISDCVRLIGLVVTSVVLWEMVQIRCFGRMSGWVKCRYGKDLPGCMICLC